jgi:hypothetical protein
MHLTWAPARLRFLAPLLAVVACGAACSSSTPPTATATTHKNGGALKVPVTVPANCPIATSGSPTAHVFIGLKATAKAGLTEKQVNSSIMIPNAKTMPCASGANYVPGPPVQVDVFFLSGATAADQNTSAATLRASGSFSAVIVQPLP